MFDIKKELDGYVVLESNGQEIVAKKDINDGILEIMPPLTTIERFSQILEMFFYKSEEKTRRNIAGCV